MGRRNGGPRKKTAGQKRAEKQHLFRRATMDRIAKNSRRIDTLNKETSRVADFHGARQNLSTSPSTASSYRFISSGLSLFSFDHIQFPVLDLFITPLYVLTNLAILYQSALLYQQDQPSDSFRFDAASTAEPQPDPIDRSSSSKLLLGAAIGAQALWYTTGLATNLFQHRRYQRAQTEIAALRENTREQSAAIDMKASGDVQAPSPT
jgi:hypothetical protein